MARTKEQDKHHREGFHAGLVVAAAICVSAHDEQVVAEEILLSAGLDTRAKAKKKGADDYDLDILKPVFAFIKQKRA
jgi:hypothetical protein